MKKKAHILVVDDMPPNIRMVRAILKDQYKLSVATNGEEALFIAAKYLPDLILLDVEMPGMDGFETCTRLKRQTDTSSIPVLFLTAKNQIEHMIKGFEVGAADYIQKPFEPVILEARINSQLQTVYYQKMKERERLLEEMHDGFGSQLMSARLMIMNGDYTRDRLVALMGECIDDLHLIVDLYGNQDATLEEALAQYRYRLKSRMADSEVALKWSFDLEQCFSLSEHNILQTLRITQEAINNSIKHAQASRIEISARCDYERGLQVTIADDGTGLPEQLHRQRGIGNMEKRAGSMGGRLSVSNRDSSGVVVEILLPPPTN